MVKEKRETKIRIQLMYMNTPLSSMEFLSMFDDFLRTTCKDDWGYRFDIEQEAGEDDVDDEMS